jgi:hypothetical protein
MGGRAGLEFWRRRISSAVARKSNHDSPVLRFSGRSLDKPAEEVMILINAIRRGGPDHPRSRVGTSVFCLFVEKI